MNEFRQLTNDAIIDVRDELLAKGDVPSLSVHDQNLYRDCDIALGVARCKPETCEEARRRVSRRVWIDNLRWISWEQHGVAAFDHPDVRPVAWPPPPQVLAFWETGFGGDAGAEAYCTVVALVVSKSEQDAVALIEGAWAPGVGAWRFNHAYPKEAPPGDRFPPPAWAIELKRWPWKDPQS